jgi:hypothetical protein
MALTGNELQQLFCLSICSICLVWFAVLVWLEPFCSRCRSATRARLCNQPQLRIVTPSRPLHPLVRVLGFFDALAQFFYWLDPKTMWGILPIWFRMFVTCFTGTLLAAIAFAMAHSTDRALRMATRAPLVPWLGPAYVALTIVTFFVSLVAGSIAVRCAADYELPVLTWLMSVWAPR